MAKKNKSSPCCDVLCFVLCILLDIIASLYFWWGEPSFHGSEAEQGGCEILVAVGLNFLSALLVVKKRWDECCGDTDDKDDDSCCCTCTCTLFTAHRISVLCNALSAVFFVLLCVVHLYENSGANVNLSYFLAAVSILVGFVPACVNNREASKDEETQQCCC